MNLTRLTLRAGLRAMELTDPILQGQVECGGIEIQLQPVAHYTDTFRLMARDLAYDIAEIPLVTLALAVDAGKPLTALPVVLAGGGLLHGALICKAESPLRGPHDLIGKKIGVRSYGQTTGVWLRGILQHEYGVDPSSIQWYVTEDSHVESFRDPGFVTRLPDQDLFDLLRRDAVDALVASPHIVKNMPGLRSVIPDARDVAIAWNKRLGIHGVNHVLALRTELVERHPDLPAQLARIFTEARTLAEQTRNQERGFSPYGAEANRRPVNLLLRFAHEQGLTQRLYDYDDLFLPWSSSMPAG